MKNILLLLLLTLSQHAFAQDTTAQKADGKSKYRKTMPVYLEPSLGSNNARMRDFATSPLYYSGLLPTFGMFVVKKTDKREVCYGIRFSKGNLKMSYNDIVAKSKIYGLAWLRYGRLYRLNVFNNPKWNLKLGGALDIVGDFRQNPSLMNNSVGYEAFTTLFVGAKIEKDISVNSQKKFLIFKIKPKYRRLSFQLDLPLMNNALRNDYIYSNSSPVANNTSLLGGYTYSFFSGFRIATKLEYEFAIFNDNRLKFSYLWDGYKSSSKNVDSFEMLNRMLLVSFVIKLR